MPHTYVLLFYIVAAACLLTWIIPAGEFQYQSVDVNGTMRKIVVPGSFRYLTDSNPVGPCGAHIHRQRRLRRRHQDGFF